MLRSVYVCVRQVGRCDEAELHLWTSPEMWMYTWWSNLFFVAVRADECMGVMLRRWNLPSWLPAQVLLWFSTLRNPAGTALRSSFWIKAKVRKPKCVCVYVVWTVWPAARSWMQHSACLLCHHILEFETFSNHLKMPDWKISHLLPIWGVD